MATPDRSAISHPDTVIGGFAGRVAERVPYARHAFFGWLLFGGGVTVVVSQIIPSTTGPAGLLFFFSLFPAMAVDQAANSRVCPFCRNQQHIETYYCAFCGADLEAETFARDGER